MNKKRFTEEQIIGVLKESEAGAKTADLAKAMTAINPDKTWRAVSTETDDEADEQ